MNNGRFPDIVKSVMDDVAVKKETNAAAQIQRQLISAWKGWVNGRKPIKNN